MSRDEAIANRTRKLDKNPNWEPDFLISAERAAVEIVRTLEAAVKRATVLAQPGDVVLLETPGGGGYGVVT